MQDTDLGVCASSRHAVQELDLLQLCSQASSLLLLALQHQIKTPVAFRELNDPVGLSVLGFEAYCCICNLPAAEPCSEASSQACAVHKEWRQGHVAP